MPAPPSQSPVQIGTTASVVGAWQPPTPQQPSRIPVRSEAGAAAANAILSPLAGGIYSALTLSARATPGGPWYARFEYATSADGYTAWTFIGNGASALSGQPSNLVWALGPLDASLTYKVRFTPYGLLGHATGMHSQSESYSSHVPRDVPASPLEGKPDLRNSSGDALGETDPPIPDERVVDLVRGTARAMAMGSARGPRLAR